MPQNTPMKRQFITIDGRTVMSNLPQHWGGNDWAITGVDNPLPVGNYVQTEAGVWIPQRGTEDGAADVRLTGSKVEHYLRFQDSITEPQTTRILATLNIEGYSYLQLAWTGANIFDGIRKGEIIIESFSHPTDESNTYRTQRIVIRNFDGLAMQDEGDSISYHTEKIPLFGVKTVVKLRNAETDIENGLNVTFNAMSIVKGV